MKKRLEKKYGKHTWRFYIHYWAACIKRLYKKPKKYTVVGQDNHLIIVEGIKEYEIPFSVIPHLSLEIKGSHNVIKIHKTNPAIWDWNFCLHMYGNYNTFEFGELVGGEWNATAYGNQNLMRVGNRTTCGKFSVALHSNQFIIGNDCMISSEEELWTDGHSVIDVKTREVLNKPISPIIIGNHVWLGRRVTLTKGAQIPDDCIVGIGSIVTKKFIEPHCVIAGNPAKIVRTGVSWDAKRPTDYINP